MQAPVPGAHNRLVSKSSAIPPLGLGYIASVLLADGFDVKIVDMDVDDVSSQRLVELVESFTPDVVGISSTTLTFKNSLRAAKIIKTLDPSIVVCLGGPSREYTAA